MSTTHTRSATHTHLAANLASLGERNGDLARRLREASPPEGLRFEPTTEGALTAILDATPLASRHRPLDEGRKLAETVDVIEHAVVVVLGFGLGYHVQAIAERLGKTGLIVVFEPDAGLLRAVFETIDHSAWMKNALLLFLTDAEDRGSLGGKLAGAESILAQGITLLEHPASRVRLGAAARTFAAAFTDLVAAAKTTLMTTLVRSVDTARNLLLNLDHYAAGPGVADLAGAARGRPAFVVSAGPSLDRNIDQLARSELREHAVIIAVQTSLKPLLRRGVRPHLVTALDYHEISRRFYEGLTAADVEGVTLVAEPKAHPAILDAFPGTVRCCANDLLDRVLGDGLRRDMGQLPAGATVAHLAVYLAVHLGCNPITLVGQDLGFTDGLYYAPGTAIHDVWAPELNPFNTIAMMEWQRIVRHRRHLAKRSDVFGRPIYTDGQMLTYLQQFERDFARCREDGIEIIDATEGGVVKQHARVERLRDVVERVLDERTREPLPPLPQGAPPDPARRASAERRVAQVEGEVAAIGRASRETVPLLRAMMRDQRDPAKMERHFRKLDRLRADVDGRREAFELIERVNQLGSFNRLKADRRLHLEHAQGAIERQRGALERDLRNVEWIADAAEELVEQLAEARRTLRGERVAIRPRAAGRDGSRDSARARSADSTTARRSTVPTASRSAPGARVAAAIPIDPDRGGLGLRRSLAEQIGGKSVLAHTLERLGRCSALESIILLAPNGFDVESLFDRSRIAKPVEIDRVDGSPYGPERAAIAAARHWADRSWRGGIGGMSAWDEVLCPAPSLAALEKRGLDALLIAGPDWPFIDCSAESGCEAVVRRYFEHPEVHGLVFAQAPPGLCGCVVSGTLLRDLATRSRLATIGALLVYQPHAPQADPIAADACVQIDHRLRRAHVRATFDTARQRAIMRRVLDRGVDPDDPIAVAEAIERDAREIVPEAPLARHVIIELNTDRSSRGPFRRAFGAAATRPPMTLALAARILGQLRAVGDIAVTFAGAGDPLLHPDLPQLVALAKESGACAVHVRSELLAPKDVVARFAASPVDVVSVELNADTAATYERVMGVDRFRDALAAIDLLASSRRHLAGPAGAAALALPWIVPRLERRDETLADLETFFDRWQHVLGAAAIDPIPPLERSGRSNRPRSRGSECAAGGRYRALETDALIPAVTPPAAMIDELESRMTILSDGRVPMSEIDLAGETSVGDAGREPLDVLWAKLRSARRSLVETLPPDAPQLRTLLP